MPNRNIFKKYRFSYQGIDSKIWLLLLVILINRIGYMAVLFLSIYFKTILQFSLGQVGLLLSSYGFGSIIGTYLGGVLSDRISTIYLLLMAFLLLAFFYLILPLIVHFYLLFGILFCLSILSAGCQPVSNIALNDYASKKNKLKVFGLYRVINNIGVSIAGFLGGYLANINFIYLFYVNGTCLLLAFIILFTLKKHLIISQNNQIILQRSSLRDVLKDKYFMTLWWLLLGSLIIFSQVTTTYTIYLNHNYHLAINKIGLIFALNGLLIAILQVPLLSYLEKFNLIKVISIGTLMLAIAFGILPFSSSFSFALILCVVWTVGEMLTFPVGMTLAMNHIDTTKKGYYMSVYHMAISISSLFFPFLGMFIYQLMGGKTLWLLCLVLGIGVALGYKRLSSQVLSSPT